MVVPFVCDDWTLLGDCSLANPGFRCVYRNTSFVLSPGCVECGCGGDLLCSVVVNDSANAVIPETVAGNYDVIEKENIYPEFVSGVCHSEVCDDKAETPFLECATPDFDQGKICYFDGDVSTVVNGETVLPVQELVYRCFTQCKTNCSVNREFVCESTFDSSLFDSCFDGPNYNQFFCGDFFVSNAGGFGFKYYPLDFLDVMINYLNPASYNNNVFDKTEFNARLSYVLNVLDISKVEFYEFLNAEFGSLKEGKVYFVYWSDLQSIGVTFPNLNFFKYLEFTGIVSQGPGNEECDPLLFNQLRDPVFSGFDVDDDGDFDCADYDPLHFDGGELYCSGIPEQGATLIDPHCATGFKEFTNCGLVDASCCYAQCGNHVVDDGEECDPGTPGIPGLTPSHLPDGVFCSSACKISDMCGGIELGFIMGGTDFMNKGVAYCESYFSGNHENDFIETELSKYNNSLSETDISSMLTDFGEAFPLTGFETIVFDVFDYENLDPQNNEDLGKLSDACAILSDYKTLMTCSLFNGHPTSAPYGSCDDNSSNPDCDCGYAYQDEHGEIFINNYNGFFNVEINKFDCMELIVKIQEQVNWNNSYVINPTDFQQLFNVKYDLHSLNLHNFNYDACPDEHEDEGGCARFKVDMTAQRSFVKSHSKNPCPEGFDPSTTGPEDYNDPWPWKEIQEDDPETQHNESRWELPEQYIDCIMLPEDLIHVVTKPLKDDCDACPKCCCRALDITAMKLSDFEALGDSEGAE